MGHINSQQSSAYRHVHFIPTHVESPQAQRINEIKWPVANVGIEVRVASQQPDRIFADEAVQRRRVIAGAIEVESGGGIVFPARVLGGVRGCSTLRSRATERLVAIGRRDRAGGVGRYC